jgi:hypothetical protein
MSEQQDDPRSYFSQGKTYLEGEKDGKRFVAEASMENADGEQLETVARWVCQNFEVNTEPKLITEAQAKALIEGKQAIRVNYQLYVWMLDD